MGISPEALYRTIDFDLPNNTASFEAVPYPGCSYREYASTYLRHSIIRKWIPSDTREADAVALNSFTTANNRCREWKVPVPEWEVDHLVYGEIRRILEDFFHPGGVPLLTSLYALNEHARPGPGAAVGAVGTSYYTKFFCSSLSSTSEYLYEMYRHYVARIPTLSEAECQRYESYGRPNIVSGSRSSFVPKTTRTSRMICVEPLLNSYYQLGLAHLLEERMKSFFGIDLTTQPLVNHRLARQGSIDGSFATIDLSSASDSISLGLCEFLLPDWFFKTLLELRSRSVQIGDQEVALFMVSTMGNGFTFPLQTIIFSSVLSACARIFGSRGQQTWSAYGDDLICHASLYDRVTHYLKQLGFVINADKSFSQGPFRESCGADWFYGQPCRPVYIRKLDSSADILVAINQLNEWSAYTGLRLSETIKLLFSALDTRHQNPVPFASNMDEGIRVPLTLCRPKRDFNGSFKYYTWSRKANRMLIYNGKVHPPGRLREVAFNPCGLYCSFLWGELVALPRGITASPFSKWDADYIMVRHDRKMYQRKPRCSPNWDYIPIDSLSNGYRLSWQQWETAVMFNMFGLSSRTNSIVSFC